MNVDVDEAATVGRRQRGVARATGRLAVLALAGRQDAALASVGGQPDGLEPAARVGTVEPSAVGHRPGAAHPLLAAAGDPPFVGRFDVDEVDLADRVVGPSLGADGDRSAIGRPAQVIDIDAGRRELARLRRSGIAGRPASPRHGRVDHPELRPAAAARDEGESPAIRRPARGRHAGRMAGDADVPRPIGLDDPDLVVADVGQPAAVGRPLGVGDVLLGRGQLDGVAASQRQHEQLPGAGRVGGVGDESIARLEPELTGRLHRDDLLDRQAGVGSPPAPTRRIRSRASAGHAGGQPIVAAYGPMLARCVRTWPWRSS